MNNSELEHRLKAAQTPARPDEYWAEFPQRVAAGVRRAPVAVRDERRWLPRLAWGLATAAACLIIGFGVGHWRGRTETASSNGLLENVKLIRETMAMFPNRVRAIVQDERGLNLVLSDRDDVPDSTPLYVSICDGKHCSSLVTFSGQEIHVAGQKMTVLSDAHGGIILVGNRFLWSNTERGYANNDLKIEAKAIGLAAM